MLCGLWHRAIEVAEELLHGRSITTVLICRTAELPLWEFCSVVFRKMQKDA